MKKYIVILASIAVLTSACAEKEGTVPGNDSSVKVSVYQYNPGEGYNPDNDVALKVSGNSKVSEAYYLIEKAEDYKTNIESKKESGYAEYVASTGTKLDLETNEFDASKYADVILTGISGENVIAVVGKAGSEYDLATINFTGLSWTDLATGTFTSKVLVGKGMAAKKTTLQSCDQIEGRYRFPDLFAPGYNYVFEISGELQTDDEGYKFYNVVVNPQQIGLTFGSYGAITVRDVSTWQSNAAYLTYNQFYPEDNYFIAWAQYYVSAGSLGYDDDEFIPDGE